MGKRSIQEVANGSSAEELMTQHIEKRICTAVRMADGTVLNMCVSLRAKAWNRQKHFVLDVELVRDSEDGQSMLWQARQTDSSKVSLVVIIRRDIRSAAS